MFKVPVIADDEEFPPHYYSVLEDECCSSDTCNFGEIKMDVSSDMSNYIPFKVKVIRPEQRNVATMCRVPDLCKSTQTQMHRRDAAVQTDKGLERIIIPIPVFIPYPVHAYRLPLIYPVPFPLPLPVPVFIPVADQAINSILNQLADIKSEFPNNDCEAEMILLAKKVVDNGSKRQSVSNNYEEPCSKRYRSLDNDAVGMETRITPSVSFKELEIDETGSLQSSYCNETIEHALECKLVEDDGLMCTGNACNKEEYGKSGRNGNEPTLNEHNGPNNNPMNLNDEPREKQQEENIQIESMKDLSLKYIFGLCAWKQWITMKNNALKDKSSDVVLLKTNILELSVYDLKDYLVLFIKEARKPNGQEYFPDTVFYFCLCIQQYLRLHGRMIDIFSDSLFNEFTSCLNVTATKFLTIYTTAECIVTRVTEEQLWECGQLGVQSPRVLLNTLMYFNIKYFNVYSLREHMNLSFKYFVKRATSKSTGTKSAASDKKKHQGRLVLRFFRQHTSATPHNVLEVSENKEEKTRCPVALYDFYLSKCPDCVKAYGQEFYLQPELHCLPDSPFWFSAQPLDCKDLEKSLNRLKMVKEVTANIGLYKDE